MYTHKHEGIVNIKSVKYKLMIFNENGILFFTSYSLQKNNTYPLSSLIQNLEQGIAKFQIFYPG